MWLVQIIWGFIDSKVFKSQIELARPLKCGYWSIDDVWCKTPRKYFYFFTVTFFFSQLIIDDIRQNQKNLLCWYFCQNLVLNYLVINITNFLLQVLLNSTSQLELTCFSRIWLESRVMRSTGKCAGGEPGNYTLEKLWGF